MDRFKENIDNQIATNRGRNILLDRPALLQFASETVKAISEIDRLDVNAIQLLIDYAADKAIEEFYRVNQYYTFDQQAKDQLKNIYAALFRSFQTQQEPIEAIAKKHYEKLKAWLQETNPFAESIYQNEGETVEPVACSEYSADLQLSVLRIVPEQLMQPVLDVGCGRHAQLVHYLRNLGIEVHGFDRYEFTSPNLHTADWLTYDYGSEKWGTIVSNLGFSNHFNHHHLREDGNYIQYGKTYMQLLASLKPGGSFHYAPDLPFIEKYLDGKLFELVKHDVEASDFQMSIIKKRR